MRHYNLTCDPPPVRDTERAFAEGVRDLLLPELARLPEDVSNAVLRPLSPGGRAASKHSRLLEVQGGARRLVVRGAVTSLNPFVRSGRIDRMRRASEAAAMAPQGVSTMPGGPVVRVPGIVATASAQRLRRGQRLWFSAEEFADADEIRPNNGRALRGLFAWMGALHAMPVATWGPGWIERDRKGGTLAEFARRSLVPDIEWELGAMKEDLAMVPSARFRQKLPGWLEQLVERLAGESGGDAADTGLFARLHGDLTPGNCLVSADVETMWVIDFARARRGLAGFEFLKTLYTFCHDDEERAPHAVDAYLSAASRADPAARLAAQLREGEPLLLFLVALDLFARPHNRIPGWKFEHRRSMPMEAFEGAVKRLLATPPGFFSDLARTDWKALIRWLRENRAFEG